MMQVRRSWWKRVVPVRVRHNIRLILGSVIVIALLGGFLGSFPLQPIVFSNGSSTLNSSVINNIEGTIDLFDLSQTHSMSFEISDIEYQQMISEFKVEGEKAWIQVDATIDGTFLKSVGIRLKGNSTLMPLGGGGDSLSMESMFGDMEMPAIPGMPEMPEGFEMPGLNMSNVSFDEPLTLPLLISFDEFVEGRGYQGRTELALRSVKEGSTNLNEAIALQLIEDSGQISQKYTWVAYSVNGSETITRQILENPSQNYVAALGRGPGVMYKSRASNSFTYHGEDQSQYAEDFLQLNAFGSHDLSPVIHFLEWLEGASDEEFDNELSEWVDIPSFAQYVVTHDLLSNFDDMSGPGRNFLFWYSLEDEKFTVVTWDMNLAINGMDGMFGGGPGGPGGFPGGGFPGFPGGGGGFPGFPGGPGPAGEAPAGFAAPEGNAPPAGFPAAPTGAPPAGFPPAPEGFDVAENAGGPPAGFPAPPGGMGMGGPGGFPAFPEGMDMTAMMQAMANGDIPEGMPEGMDMGMGMPGINFGNTLKQRFTDSEIFSEIIAETRIELLEFWFGSGRGENILNELVKSVPVTDRLSVEQIATEVAALSEAMSGVK